jgi:predicted MFS family arabinose efflux permease
MSYIKARLRVLKNRNLLFHMINCFLATLGHGMAHILMMWMVLENNNSIAAAALLMGCLWLPGVVLAPIIGVITDRFERKPLLMFNYFLRALSLFIAAFCFYVSPSLNILYLLSIMVGTCMALHMPLTVALIREITTEEDLFYANATVDMAYEIGFMIGMTLGGAAIAILSNTTSLILNGILFVGAMGFTMAMRVPKRRDPNESKSTLASYFKDAHDGLIYLRQRPHLAKIYTLQMVLMVCYTTAPILLAPFVKGVLMGDAKDLGIIEAAFSVGMVLGSLITPYLARRFSENKIFVQLSFGLLVSYFLFMFCSNTFEACMIYIAIGFCLSTWALCMTRAQKNTDGDYQGRLQATFNAFTGIAILLTYAMVSLLSVWIPIQFAYGAQVVFAIAALGLVFAVNRLEDL